MANQNNKVKFGLDNVHYALLTLDDSGVPSYDTPKPFPGAVSISLDAQGDQTNFRADNVDYYVARANTGYDGDLEVAMVPDDFRENVLNEYKDSKGVYVEDANAPTQTFALLFRFKGDTHKTDHVLYNCTAGRTSVNSQTTDRNNADPVTETLPISASTVYNADLDKDIVKARTSADTDAATVKSWYSKVYQPTAAAAAPDGGGQTA